MNAVGMRSTAHLSNLEVVPDVAVPHLQWAFDQVIERRITQKALLPLLNMRLEDAGAKPASLSSLNRWAQRVRTGEVKRPGGRIPPHDLSISLETRRLIAAALRALANDLDPTGVA